MKQEIARQWVAALRSGEYTMGRMRLRSRDDKFCVLGVLCNLHALAHPNKAAAQTRKTSYMGEMFILPSDVMEWSGMTTADGAYTTGLHRTSLTVENDSGTSSFLTLADTIQSLWKTL